MIGYKAARNGSGLALVRLKILGATRGGSVSVNEKMRTSKAKVLGIRRIVLVKTKGKYIYDSLWPDSRYWVPGTEKDKSGRKLGKSLKSARSDYAHSFKYRVGRIVEPNYFEQSDLTCAGGIHFFKSKKRAMMYL